MEITIVNGLALICLMPLLNFKLFEQSFDCGRIRMPHSLLAYRVLLFARSLCRSVVKSFGHKCEPVSALLGPSPKARRQPLPDSFKKSGVFERLKLLLGLAAQHWLAYGER
jgi:hypothetical protein